MDGSARLLIAFELLGLPMEAFVVAERQREVPLAGPAAIFFFFSLFFSFFLRGRPAVSALVEGRDRGVVVPVVVGALLPGRRVVSAYNEVGAVLRSSLTRGGGGAVVRGRGGAL